MSIAGITPILFIILLIPVLIGIYVYRDARRRKLNAPLWTLVAALAPSFIGFIIYLLVRSGSPDLCCPNCHQPVQPRYMVCPRCGAKLHLACPACAQPVEPDWIACPRCAAELPEQQSDVTPPVRRKDKELGRILIAVILVPALMIVFILTRTMFDPGSSSFSSYTESEYFAQQESESIAIKVQEWMAEFSPSSGQAYALRYDYRSGDHNEYFYLICIPGAGEQHLAEFGQSAGLLRPTLSLNLTNTGGSSMFYAVTSTAKKPPRLKLSLDGKRIPCQTTVVDYNPTLHYIVPNYSDAVLQEEAAEIFLPERITVSKIVRNHNTAAVAVSEEEMFRLLSSLDSAPYLDIEHTIYPQPDGSGGYDFKDGFDIIIEYRVHSEYVLHNDMIHCLVLEQNGAYYIIDSYRPDDGRFIRQTTGEFYDMLQHLFEE